MPSITVRNFAGMRPSVYDSNLDDRFANIARDVDLEDGIIRPRETYTQLKTSEQDIVTVIQPSDLDGNCLDLCCYDECVSVVTAPLGRCSGPSSLAVFPRYGEPYRQTLPDKEHKCLYVPPPEQAPVATVTDPGTLEAQDTRFYLYTWSDEYGVESPPSPPSDQVTLGEDGCVDLTNLQDAPECACFINIYRTAPPFRVGDDPNLRPNETTWQLVATIPVGATSYKDNKPLLEACLGTLMTIEDCPPVPMCKVVMTESGYYVGFDKNNIYISERHEAHNWPEYNYKKIPDRIVDITAYYDGVFITTTSRPYYMSVNLGQDGFAQTNFLPFQRVAPGKGGTLVTTSFGAAYVADEGLMALSPRGNAVDLTDGRISRREWERRMPCSLVWKNGYVYGFRSDGCSFVLDVSNRENEQLEPGDFVELSIPATSATCGEKGDILFINNGAVYKIGGPIGPYTWESKEFTVPFKTAFTAAKVVSSGGPVRFRIWCGQKLVFDKEIKTNKPLRLPRYRGHTEWRFRLDGYATVREVSLATSIRDLSEV